MKSVKKIMLLMLLLLVSASLIYTLRQAGSLGKTAADSAATANAQQELSNTILRFHVLANSDTDEDQAQKLAVKEAVLEYLEPLLADADSKQEVCERINSHLPEIISVAEEITQPEVSGRYVTAAITNCYFPIKTYGDMTFPAGYYDALEIEIGSANGQNWWCVMYPQLCFIDLCYGTVPDSSKELLSSQLSEPTYDSLLQSAPQTASGADSGKNTDDAVSGSDENTRSERPQIGFWFLKLLAE